MPAQLLGESAVGLGGGQAAHRDHPQNGDRVQPDHRERAVRCRAARARAPSAWCSAPGSPASARSSARRCRSSRERLRVDALLGEVEVQVDPSQLHQIVWNLCENAVKYGATAGNDSDRAAHRPPRSTARPFLEVADRGPGHRCAACASGFSSRSSRGSDGGTGLGLFISRELARPTARCCSTSRAPAAAASSASCSPIRSAGMA